MADTLPSGRFVIRAPHTLHAALKKRAKEEGVSLNDLVASVLASRASLMEGKTKSCKNWGCNG